MQQIITIWIILVKDYPGTIPVEFGQKPISGLRLYNSMLNCDPRDMVDSDPWGIIWTTLVEDL